MWWQCIGGGGGWYDAWISDRMVCGVCVGYAVGVGSATVACGGVQGETAGVVVGASVWGCV